MLFAALCAYVGAALYPQLASSGALPAMAEREAPPVRLEGIALRRELALSLPEGPALFARDGDRLSGDAALAAAAGEDSAESLGSCLFLAFCDGLEYLSPEAALPLSVEKLRSLMSLPAPENRRDARLVQGFDWYYAAVTDYKGALPEGKYSLRFDGFEESVKARLVEVSSFDKGERALLFRLMVGNAEYLKLRMVGAELVLPE